MMTQVKYVRSARRSVYRQAKKILGAALRARWQGLPLNMRRADLRLAVQAWLKGKNRAYLLRLVRHRAFALSVASTLLVCADARASAPIDLSAVAAGTGGFVINGIDADDRSGWSVSGAGDVNGDGLADVIVGARFASPGGDYRAGESYVVFGKANGAGVDLSAVSSGTGGFAIIGIDENDYSGRSVSGAGDVNGDGLADLIVGAIGADPGGVSAAGENYVVFGKASGTAVELSSVASGTGGFVINGIDESDNCGVSVSGAGDVNGDGLADLIVGASLADLGGDSAAGESYLVFGKASGAAIELSTVASGTGGFLINGIDAYDRSGVSVSGAGDVNGDGIADLIVGAWQADPGGGNGEQGESYVVFGKADATAVELSTIASGTGGFVINGIDSNDFSGYSVSGMGDVNGDGLADLIVGAVRGDPGGDMDAGESYVVFGKADSTAVELSAVATGTGGFLMNGIDADDRAGVSVSRAGDVNGDNLADLIVGAWKADPGGDTDAGESYVVFGKADGTVVELSAVATGVGGFLMNGIDAYDASGISVSGAGDVNGDGLADLIVGARDADPGGESDAGESYVVFSPEPAQGRKLWVDFAHGGTEEGTHPLPFDTLQEAVTGVFSGGTIVIKGDTADGDSPETLTINQAVTIEAIGGTVSIGDAAARGADSAGGFVSGKRD